MEAAEKGLTESGASMSKKQSENDGDEVVVEVQIEDMEDGAPGSCLKGGLESSSSNQVSKVSSPLNSPEITSFCNPLIPDKGKSSSLGHMAIDSDVLEEEGDIEEIGSPSNNSPHKEVEVDEEDEDMVMKFSSSRKVKKKKVLMLMEWIILACSLGVLVASFTVKKLENHKAWGLEMWKWCVIVMLSFCGILITNWVLTLLVFVIERNFLFMMKDKIYLVHRMKRSVQVFLWLGMVLLTWLLFFKFNRGGERSETTTKILDHVMWTLVSLLIGAFLWMLSTLLFKSLASKFMAVAYFDRIQESLFNQYVIETLSGPPILEGAGIRRSLSTGFASLRRTYSVEKKVTSKVNVSVETMDALVGAVSTRNDGIRSESKAKAAAVQIFQNVAMHGKKYIEEEDLMRFLDREEVDRVLPLIEGAMENGRIKRNDLATWMINVYRERNALRYSINDTKTVLKQIEKFFIGTVIIVTIVVWLLLVGIASTNLVVFLSTQFLLAAFMFGNTCKNVFEAIVFIFVTHPFDVGDRIVVDDVPFVVEEMNVLTTTFLKSNNEKVYYPNSVLCTKTISNYYRSPDMGDSVKFSIVLTPVEKIDMLRKKIAEYFDSKPQHWQPGYSMAVLDIVDVNKLKMALYVVHTMNYQDTGERDKRRTELVIKLMRTLEELDITYNLLPHEGRSPHSK